MEARDAIPCQAQQQVRNQKISLVAARFLAPHTTGHLPAQQSLLSQTHVLVPGPNPLAITQ